MNPVAPSDDPLIDKEENLFTKKEIALQPLNGNNLLGILSYVKFWLLKPI